jgi:hypothetical protein
MTLSSAELAELAAARADLEHDSFTLRLATVAGRPVEVAAGTLPSFVERRLHGVVEAVLDRLAGLAWHTLSSDAVAHAASPALHRRLAAAAGAVGGAFGWPGLIIELPLSTTILLRAIGDVARAAGEDLADPAVREACLEVFALGGHDLGDDAAESGYFAVRAGLTIGVRRAVAGLAGSGGSLGVRLAARVADRFAGRLLQKLAAQGLPILGAIGGAAVNAAFADHLLTVARGHFTIRRLERRHGEAAVREAWEKTTVPTTVPGFPIGQSFQ